MVGEFHRDGPLRAGSFGPSLNEAKGLLAAVQSRLARAQLDAHVATQWHCEHCGERRWTKDWRTVRFRSLFTVPYARASEILGLLLPAQAGGSTSSVRRRALSVGLRLDAELQATGSREPAPEPATATSRGPLGMALDGGFVRHC